MTCDSENLTSQREVIGPPVLIPNEDKIRVKGVDKTILPNGFKIDNVLNIPDFECDLLSVSKLTKDLNCAITFFADSCVVHDLHSRKLIGGGRLCDGLYCLELMQNERVQCQWQQS